MFEVHDVNGWSPDLEEPMGTKSKIWLIDGHGDPYLFKEPRAGTGEAWAEKAAAEIADIMGLPHAHVDLAVCGDKRGTISQAFVQKSCGEDITHGNQLMSDVVVGYDMQQFRGQSQHNLENIITALQRLHVRAPSGSRGMAASMSGLEVFAGYLVLDALICNTDRHHENWAIMTSTQGSPTLAPTYDHASSLGRELSDKKRDVAKADQGVLSAYLDRCRSGIFRNSGDTRACHPLILVEDISATVTDGTIAWIDTLGAIDYSMVEPVFSSFPDGWISDAASEFALALMQMTRKRLKVIRDRL